MRSKVSARGRTVIPLAIREALGIQAGDVLAWRLHDGAILVYPLPADPVRAAVGILTGKGTFDEFLDDRRAQRAREHDGERE